MVRAFADEGVVRLLTKKMKMCEAAASQGASTRSARSRKKVRSATAGTALKAPSPLAVKNTSRSSAAGNSGKNRFHHSSSAMPDEENAPVLPLDADAGANGAQQRSLVCRCDESSMPTLTANSKVKSAVPVSLGLEKGKRDDVNACARMAVLEDAGGGCPEQRKMLAMIRDRAIGHDAKGSFAVRDKEAGSEIKSASPLQVVGKGRPSSSCIDIGDGLGAQDFLCKQSNTSDEGGPTAAVTSLPNEDCPQLFSTRGRHREMGSWVPATCSEIGGAKATTPPSSVGIEGDQSPAGAEASTAATPSPMGALVESNTSVEEGELGSLLSTFERQVKRGADWVRRFEKSENPSLALDDDVKVEGGGGRAESGNKNTSTTASSSISSEEKQSAEIPNIATGIAGVVVETEESMQEPPGEVDMGSARGPERTETTSNTEEALLCLSGVAEQTSTDRGESINRSLSTLREQNSLADTNTTTVDEDSEDYEFTFDDEEEMDVGQKRVQFTDESRWSTHEVRACFEQHELGELFYTTAELESMLEEAESEEALERSKALVSQGKEPLDDTAAAGGSSDRLLSFGGNQEPKRSICKGPRENMLFDTISFDGEDSDYDF